MYPDTPQDDLLAAQRRAKALEMRLNGHTFEQIAAECGYTHKSAARKAYNAALRAVVGSKPNKERMRMTHLALLGMYRQALALNVGGHEARAVEVLLKAMEHEAKLFGLYAEPAPATAVALEIFEYPSGFRAAIRGEAAPAQIAESESDK